MKKIVPVVLLTLLVSVAANAVTKHTELTAGRPPLPAPDTTISLDASATFENSVWSYSYVIDTTNAKYNITGFSVADAPGYQFFDAWNDKGFVDPVWTSTSDSVYWMGKSVAPGGVFNFGFKSAIGPDVIVCTLHGGTPKAAGDTLSMVPEPMSIGALGSMLLGGLAAFRRRSNR